MNAEPTVILSSSYLAPIQYYAKLVEANCVIDECEHFLKQSFRNRCEIYSPNGKHTLSVPLQKRYKRKPVKDVKIANEENWQVIHWRTLESSYRRSAFFEYFEDEFYPIYHDKKFEYLVDLNITLQELICNLLGISSNYTKSREYITVDEGMIDGRELIHPKRNYEDDSSFTPVKYFQVFDDKHGFIPNLSILDLLFNQGPQSLTYINGAE